MEHLHGVQYKKFRKLVIFVYGLYLFSNRWRLVQEFQWCDYTVVIVFEVVFGGGNISSSYSRLLKVRWAGKLSTTGTKLEPRLQRYVGNKTSGEVRRFHVDWQSNMCNCSMCQKEHRGTCKERHDNKICKNSFYVFLKECCSIALVKNTGKGVIPLMVRVCKSFVLWWYLEK